MESATIVNIARSFSPSYFPLSSALHSGSGDLGQIHFVV